MAGFWLWWSIRAFIRTRARVHIDGRLDDLTIHRAGAGIIKRDPQPILIDPYRRNERIDDLPPEFNGRSVALFEALQPVHNEVTVNPRDRCLLQRDSVLQPRGLGF